MTVNISSSAQFRTLLTTSNVVIADFYADWCGPCKAVAPVYEQLSRKFSKPNAITFTKINVDNQQAIAQQYGVTAMPTFMIFRSGSVINNIRGADPRALTAAVEAAAKLSTAAKPAYSSVGRTLGGTPATSRSGRSGASLQSWFDAIVAFFGLYIISLISIDPYKSAEASPFNIHRPPPAPVSSAARAAGVKPVVAGRKVGTMADISE